MKYISKKLYIFPALALLISLIAYPLLPEQIPIHFDFNGNPDNYSGKLFVLMIPIIMAALLVLADFLPKADPKSANYAKFPKAYQLLHVLVQLLLLVTHIVTVAYPILQMNGSLWGVTFVSGNFNQLCRITIYFNSILGRDFYIFIIHTVFDTNGNSYFIFALGNLSRSIKRSVPFNLGYIGACGFGNGRFVGKHLPGLGFIYGNIKNGNVCRKHICRQYAEKHT